MPSPETRSTSEQFDGCMNARDLGGLPTRDGGVTRRGALVRGDCVHHLSAAGWDRLAAHGVRSVVDLRMESELVEPRTQPGITFVHAPVFGEGFSSWALDPDLTMSQSDFYSVAYDRFARRFTAAVRAIAVAPGGGVFVHCHVGKDRTGLLVALALEAVGVTRDAIVADYALSAPNVAEYLREWVDSAADELQRGVRLRGVAGAPETLRETLERLDERHGGAEAYLRAAGLLDAELSALRRRLVTGPWS
jgi:protein-tyrosine phosphatase